MVTLELPHALDMPNEEELAQVWRDMQDWLKRNLVVRKTGASPWNSLQAGRLVAYKR